jgi:DNA-binding IclR family transcriptional regulator
MNCGGALDDGKQAGGKALDVKTAGRTVEVFEIFAKSQGPLSLTEIARALEAPLSSCLYLVRSLENRGYLYTVGAQRQIYPTQKILDLGRAIAAGESWVARLGPALARLRDATMETVLLGKRQANRIVYLSVLEGPQTIRYTAHVGDVKPMHASAIGKAMLSALEPAELKKVLPKLSLDALTPATITDKNALLEDLKQATARGYAKTRGEGVVDVMAIAKSFVSHDQYGLGVAGPLYRMAEKIDSHVEFLRKACEEIEKLRS